MEEAEKSRGCRNIGLDIPQIISVAAGADRDGKEVLSLCRVELAGFEWRSLPLQENGFLERKNRSHYKTGLLFMRWFSTLFLFTP